eukprot:4855368-Prymnesium_polylepis.2
MRGQGFGWYGSPLCRFDNLPPKNASLHIEGNSSHGTELLVCYAPSYTLAEGALSELVPLAISLNGQQFHGGYKFRFAALCPGRELLEYYAPDAQRQILRYLKASSPALQHDADGDGQLSILEVEAAIRAQIVNVTDYDPSDGELRALAEATCFEAGTPGRTFARLDDTRDMLFNH